MQEWTMLLEGGRRIGAAEYGDPGGKSVFLFHGQPGNRLFHPNVEVTRHAGVRLIVPDRPGYGLSTSQPGRTLLDWPGDVAAMADYIGAKRFDVIGFSGGGPYALACAYAIPDRLGRVAVVSGAPPMAVAELRREMLRLAQMNYFLIKYGKRINRLIFRMYWRQSRKNPQGFLKLMSKQGAEVDRSVLTDPVIGEMLAAAWEENLRVDSLGYVYDAEILMSDWGFGLDEIQIPVELWWGRQDQNVPPAVMEYFCLQLKHCKPRILPEAGHFGLLDHWRNILEGVVQID